MPVTSAPGISRAIIEQLVAEALAKAGAVTSIPPSEDEERVENLFVVKVGGLPRLEVEYEEGD